MYYAVKTLLETGKSISEVARELGIDRKTVRKIRDKVKEVVKVPAIKRRSILDPYRDLIMEYLNEEGLTGVLIHKRLVEEYNLNVTYNCVKKYVRKLRPVEGAYVPIITPPGFEGQVDFGYAGYFIKDGKKIKCWIFNMRLSYSRYDYYEIVEKEDVNTFINCHIHAFEFFGGTPETVKIDNLKSGVLSANFYEPSIQIYYANMLKHYGSNPITCKINNPREKGKVESGIKYVKNNFLKGLKSKDYYEAKSSLSKWTNEVNKRIHGTTRKVPYEQFINKEKDKLKKLPEQRYELWELDRRVVNKYGHISYRYNFYSVPSAYVGKTVHIKSNNRILKIYDEEFKEIANHIINNNKGEFITVEAHNPRLNNIMSEKDYENKSKNIGVNTVLFFHKLKEKKPYHYHRMMRGIFKLTKIYSEKIVDAACKRAVKFGSFSYLSVRKICEDGLYELDECANQSVTCGGFGNDLKLYDTLTDGEGIE